MASSDDTPIPAVRRRSFEEHIGDVPPATRQSEPRPASREPSWPPRRFEAGYSSFERDVTFEELGGGVFERELEVTFNRAYLQLPYSPLKELTLFTGIVAEDVEEDAFVEAPSTDGLGLRFGGEGDVELLPRLHVTLDLRGGLIWHRETSLPSEIELRYGEVYAGGGVGFDLIRTEDGGLLGAGRVMARGGVYYDGMLGRYEGRVRFGGSSFEVKDDLRSEGVGVYLSMDVLSRPLFLRAVAWFGEREGIGFIAGAAF
jgi:hypothetical protein